MGKRLAEAGCAVLTVNPFYRSIKGQPATRKDAFSYARTLSATTHVSDAKAFVAWLDAQDAVDTRRKIGIPAIDLDRRRGRHLPIGSTRWGHFS